MKLHLYLFFAVVFLFCTVSSASAVIYKWTDESGVTHFTDDQKKIPDKYREKAVDFDQVESKGSVTYDPNFGKTSAPTQGEKEPFYKRFLRQLEEERIKREKASAKKPEVVLYMTDW
jgi:hypothetical protein